MLDTASLEPIPSYFSCQYFCLLHTFCSLQAGEACLYQTIVVLGKQWYEQSFGLGVLLSQVILDDYVSNDVGMNMHS